MAIYTKKGDKGKTKVFDKKSGNLVGVSKRSCKIRSIGTIDELNSWLGVVRNFCTDENLNKQILEVQGNLFTINSILAGSSLRFSGTKIKKLERQIDEWEAKLPVQKNFVYYGGSGVASLLFYARAICRRAERSLVTFYKKSEITTQQPLVYMNRLSDYFFIMARMVNFKQKEKEIYWITKKRK